MPRPTVTDFTHNFYKYNNLKQLKQFEINRYNTNHLLPYRTKKQGSYLRSEGLKLHRVGSGMIENKVGWKNMWLYNFFSIG